MTVPPGICPNAAKHRRPASALRHISGTESMVLTMAIPVTAHMTAVSQKGPVIEIKPCLAGDSSPEAAAAIGIEPSPASFVKSPLATPVRTASISPPPAAPPAAARPEKASVSISPSASGSTAELRNKRSRQLPRYRILITGTSQLQTPAINRFPPMIMTPASTHTTAATACGGTLASSDTAI